MGTRYLVDLRARRQRALGQELERQVRQRGETPELDDLKSRLFANVSHEFRTPLALVLGPLRDLEAGVHGPLSPAVAAQVALARRNTEHILVLVDEILDIARWDSDAGTEPPEAVPLHPLAPEPAGGAGPPPPEPTTLDDLLDDRTTVLVVDDQPDIRAFVRSQLEKRYRILEAADGAEGYRVARESLPDLVLTDLVMPEMDGLELTRRLKADPELDYVPVVLLTAKGSAKSKLEGLGQGADDYLTKPFDALELVARIDNLIRQRRRLLERFAAGALSPLATRSPGRLSAGDRAFLERTRQALEEGLGDEDFNVERLAAQLAVDRSQLFRRLKEITGATPSELLVEARLTRASELLARDEGGVGEVAAAVGFKSVAHFSERFRRRFGTTPSAWRRHQTGDRQPA